jgi:DHA1 family multidrug resistance protein-like MFS transporter
MSARRAATRLATTTCRGVRDRVPCLSKDRAVDVDRVVRTNANTWCFSATLHRDDGLDYDDRRASARAAGPLIKGFANTYSTHTNRKRTAPQTQVSSFTVHRRNQASADHPQSKGDDDDANAANAPAVTKNKPAFADYFTKSSYKDLPQGTFEISVVSGVLMAGHACVAPVLPAFAIEFGASAAEVGATLSSFALARLVLNYPFGLFADWKGRRPLLVIGPLITACGMLGCAFSATLPELLFHRFVAGAGSAAYAAGAAATLTDLSTQNNRGRVLGANQAFSLAGAAVGPALGGALAGVTYFGEFATRAPFVAVGGLCLVAAAHAARKAPETLSVPTTSRVNSHTNTVGTHTGALTTTSEEVVSGHDGTFEWKTPSGESSEKISRVSKARSDFFAASGVNSALFFSGSGGRATLLPLLAASTHGLDVGEIGTLFSAMALTSLVGAWPASLLADSFPRRNVVVGAMSVSTLAVLATAMAPSKELFIASSIAWAAAHAAMGPAPAAYAADVSGPKQNRGTSLATYRTCGDVGMLIGPVFLGACADVVGAPAALAVNGVILGTAAVGFRLMASNRDHRGLGSLKKTTTVS